ncbi:hypothetical protein SRABI76_00442 [Microbacterium oxydans]|uniref:hypothetical protein n=1 Tax=Microbacterium oxydans TaxID=82380 RepID=UPI001DD003D6|nr:hypothetical protein [Microbacterium oxydans]CAH0137003.1 hypothetical protein SRABI76_00442 [Microbacterium oxydans]
MTEASPSENRFDGAPGGHALPARFSDSPSPAPQTRKKHTGLLFGILGAVVAVVAIGALQLTSNLRYDDAEAQLRDTATTASDAKTTVRDANEVLVSSTDAATLILESDTGALVDAATHEALASAGASASEVAAAAESTLAEPISSPGEKPTWFWELYGEADALTADREKLDALTARLSEESEEIDRATTSLTDAGLTTLSVAAANATGLESAHISARNDNVIALREAAEVASTTVVIDQQAADGFGTLQTAAAQLIESETAELAEKAGPLYNARLEIEAFARSIAPGVLLEFDWAPIVNGYGDDGGMGGYTTWWWDEPGRAVILLSNSVAEQWPADRSKALVVHEVGHAISVKCADMYDASTQDSIEKWATAWAISMGYNDDANGVWAYGYPPQSYIDAAAGCR